MTGRIMGPASFGAVALSCWPAIVMTIIVLAAILAFISAIRLTAWAIRWWRRGRREYRQLLKAGNVDLAVARGATRAMSIAERDAIHGPRLAELTGPDHVVTGQLAAVQDALTPRMVAPTRADLRGIDPDPALGCLFCRPPFEVTAYCTCSRACEDPQCGYLQWLRAGEQS